MWTDINEKRITKMECRMKSEDGKFKKIRNVDDS